MFFVKHALSLSQGTNFKILQQLRELSAPSFCKPLQCSLTLAQLTDVCFVFDQVLISVSSVHKLWSERNKNITAIDRFSILSPMNHVIHIYFFSFS